VQTLAKIVTSQALDILITTQGILQGKQRKTNSAGIELDMATSF